MPRLSRSHDGRSAEPGALALAIRDAARFDRGSISAPAGVLAAVPVVVLLGGGLAAGDRVAAVTMAAGAMLVGIAWRVTGGRPPLALMATDAAVMAATTFVGCVTGSMAWLHLVLLALWSFVGGLLVSVGPRGGVLGTQAIISFIVFGRFSQPAPQALGLAAYILVGGWTQVLFLTLVRWPRPLSAQRHATAAAYRALGTLAARPPLSSTLPAGAALDDAQAALAGGALFADPALMTLRTLVSEGFRLRVQLGAIQALLARAGPEGETARDALRLTAQALGLAADAIEGNDAAGPRLAETAAALGAARTDPPPGVSDPAPDSSDPLGRRLTALAGQVRAVAGLAPEAGAGRGLRSRRRLPRTHRTLEQLRGDVQTVRANLSRESPAGRHAVRLAVVVPLAELVSRELPIQRGYWMVVAAATVLRPEFGATFTRGTERALGTALGVALAGAIAVGLHPAGAVTVTIVGLLAWAGYALFPASFAVGFAFITALVVFLLNGISPDTLSTASTRLLDTLIGGALGLAIYAAWPTWSAPTARRALADLIAAQRAYIVRALAALAAGGRARDLGPMSRRARLARTSAEATVGRSLSEPVEHRIDPNLSQSVLAAARRLVLAAHVVRLDAEEEREREPLPELAALADGLERLLDTVEHRLRGDGDASDPASAQVAEPLPDLRAAYNALAARNGDHPEAEPLLAELDEIVDAANGLAALVGLDPAA